MPGRIIKTKEDVDGWVDAIKGQPLPLTVSFTRGEKRSNPQNKTIHMWYGEIASQLGDTTSIEVRAECKLIFGVPILRRDDDVFRADYDRDFRPFQYETKLRLFRLLDPAITSLMKVPQLREYMDEMQRHYAQIGVRLTDPEMRRYEGWQS